MNVDDKEFILALLDDMELLLIHTDKDWMLAKIARARSLLEKGFYRTKEEKKHKPREEDLNFNDWHSAVYDEEYED